MDLYRPRSPSGGGRDKKRSFLRRTWRGTRFLAGAPVASIGVGEISKGAHLIERLFGILEERTAGRYALQDRRRRPDRPCGDGLFPRDHCRGPDQASTGAAVPNGVGGLCAVLPRRGASAALAICGTAYGDEPCPHGGRYRVSAICAVFFLLAFKSAWMNWQLRMRRPGSAVAYLRTRAPFLPH